MSGRRRIRSELGDLVFGVGDDTMESVVLDLCRDTGLTLGLAESVTGGLVGARLTGIPGASDVFVGSIVSYATSVKQNRARRLTRARGGRVGCTADGSRAHMERLGLRRCDVAHRGRRTSRAGRPTGRDALRRPGGPGFDEVREIRLPGTARADATVRGDHRARDAAPVARRLPDGSAARPFGIVPAQD